MLTAAPEKSRVLDSVLFIPAARQAAATWPRLLLGLAFALTFLAYVQVWRFDFVYDDHLQIVNNPKISDWSRAGSYFTSHLWANAGNFDRASNYYRPLFLLWLRLNRALFGLRASWWHASSLALHLLAVWLVYLAVLRLLALMDGEQPTRKLTAALAALLFGLHPVHTEAVAWVSASSELLLTIFFLLAFIAYADGAMADGRSSWRWKVASIGFFAAALLSKETAVMLVPLLLCCQVFVRRSREPESGWTTTLLHAALAAGPWLAVALAYLVVRRLVLGELGHTQVLLTNDVVLKTLPALLWFYVRHLVWPYPLAALYDVFYVKFVHSRQFVLPLAAVVVSAVVLWAACRKSRPAQVAALWIGLTLLPVLDVALLRFNTLAQDRYLYLPSLGFCTIVALALVRLSAVPRIGRAAVYAVLVLILLIGVVTSREVAPWENDLLLFENAVAVSPENAMAKTNLAAELMVRGENGPALQLLLASYDRDAYAWNTSYNLGYLYFNRGELPEAERFFQHAIQLDAHNRNQYLMLGLTQKRMGSFADAADTLRKTAELWPEAPLIHLSLGEVLEQQGQYAEAISEYRKESSANGSAAAKGALERLQAR